jgi:hypothetical protein
MRVVRELQNATHNLPPRAKESLGLAQIPEVRSICGHAISLEKLILHVRCAVTKARKHNVRSFGQVIGAFLCSLPWVFTGWADEMAEMGGFL